MQSVDAALKYCEMGFSVIPIRPDKKPYTKWTEYQKRQATPDEIRRLWKLHPEAMIGIVTGEISGIFVIDCDSEEAYLKAQEHLPESLVTCVAKTPRGYHIYFLMPRDKSITNAAGVISGIDVRGEGGYIIAPPSVNGNGEGYEWLPGLSIFETEPSELPDAIYNTIILHKGTKDKNYTELRKTTESYENYAKLFTQGRRDEDLFSAANALIKGGLPEQFARNILQRLALSCNPPFNEKDAQVKIDSALTRIARRERNLSEEIRDWVKATQGYFQTTEIHAELRLTTPEEKKACYSLLLRMCDRNEIEKHGQRRGCFRVINDTCEAMNFLEADTQTVPLRLPFEIHNRVIFFPGNLIVIAGSPNAGKTAFLINVIRQNMNRFEIHYFNSEMGGAEFRKRLEKVKGMNLSDWHFNAWERSDNFQDVIKPGKGKLNIIDFLEVHDEFYKVGGTLAEIHRKLKGSLCIVALQKNPGSNTGLGGFRTLEKPRLALAMDAGKLKIVKAKNWATGINPNGLEIEFKIVNGCELIAQETWSK